MFYPGTSDEQDSSKFGERGWTSRSTSSVSTTAWSGLAYAPSINTWVAVARTGTNRLAVSGASGTIAGISWIFGGLAQNNAMRDVVWCSGLNLFAAVSSGGTNRVQTSTDGVSWTVRTAAGANSWECMSYSPSLNRICAFATSATPVQQCMTSTDGTTWVFSTTFPSIFFFPQATTWSPDVGKFVVLGQGVTNPCAYSTDGVNWTQGSGLDNISWRSVCWSTEVGLYVAVAESGTNRVATSPDGINWTMRSAAAANSWNGVCYAPDIGKFVAVSYDGATRSMVSTDGINWSLGNLTIAEGWRNVAWSPTRRQLVAVADPGSTQTIATSN